MSRFQLTGRIFRHRFQAFTSERIADTVPAAANIDLEPHRHSINLITCKPTQQDSKASTSCIKKLYWRFYVKNWTSREKLYYSSSGLWIGWAAGNGVRSLDSKHHSADSSIDISTFKFHQESRLKVKKSVLVMHTSNQQGSAAMFGAVQGRRCFLNLTRIIARGKDINNHKGNLWALVLIRYLYLSGIWHSF